MAMAAELVLIPWPVHSHILPLLDFAKLLLQRDSRLSITVIIIPSDHFKTIPSSSSLSSTRIRFVELPRLSDDDVDASSNFILHMHSLVMKQKPHVKEAMHRLVSTDSVRLAGIVVDMFCTPYLDVADHLGVPGYVYHTSGAQFLSLSLYLQSLRDEEGKDPSELIDSDGELTVPGIVNPVPTKVLPRVLLQNKEVAATFASHARRYRESKGILVTTFEELESHTVDYFASADLPPVYPVGPLLHISMGPNDNNKSFDVDVVRWLDDQPSSSVVFLCFGSRGSFNEQQVKEIAYALERSGYRFLWSLRQANGPRGASDYVNPVEVLPEGFLDRTAELGRVIGWASQMDILAHPSVGGFVSHCGWNSTLESVWFGVPMATWPLYAEQQFNAFSLLKEFGLAVEIKMDYTKECLKEEPRMVSAEEIERGIRSLMGLDDERKMKVKKMSEKCRKAVKEGGSSFTNLGHFINGALKKKSFN